jgi:hypothetical protein
MKENIKEKIASSASALGGAAAGVVLGTVASANEAQAAETDTPVDEPAEAEEPQVVAVEEPVYTSHNQATHEVPQEVHVETHTEVPVETVSPVDPPAEVADNSFVHMDIFGDNDVEVVDYGRDTTESGEQVDVALVHVNGQEFGIIDANLDGQADIIAGDLNQNGHIDANEVFDVHDQGISMEPLQDAADFNPLLSQNDLPDYVNNADVDTYMA